MRLVLSTWKSLGTWYADTQNKTRGKYFPVRSAAAIPAADGLVSGVRLPDAQSKVRWKIYGIAVKILQN